MSLSETENRDQMLYLHSPLAVGLQIIQAAGLQAVGLRSTQAAETRVKQIVEMALGQKPGVPAVGHNHWRKRIVLGKWAADNRPL